MKKSAFVLSPTVLALFATSAFAGEIAPFQNGPDLTVEQASQYLHYSGGNDRFRVEVAPNYSEELGVSLKGAAGGYLTDAFALGLIVEYGEDKREYLANAGIQFNDAVSLVGTIGMLEEHIEYVDGEGKETVQQMEYGASLKGAYESGLLSGFALNGYRVDAEADDDSVETGKLYGVQLISDVDLTDTTHIEIGGGYEWLEWDETGGDDSSWTFSAEAAQQLGDMLSLTGHAKLGASEYVYGGGLAFDLSNGGLNTNSLAVNYSYIDGQNGIEDDQRVELSWTFGFGAGPSTSVAAADLTDKSGTIRAAADVAMVSPANNLRNDVMKRPAYLPERVLARKMAGGEVEEGLCPLTIYAYRLQGVGFSYPYVDEVNQYSNIAGNLGEIYVHFISSDPAVDFTLWTMTLGGFTLYLPQGPEQLKIYPSETFTGIRYARVYAPSLEGSQIFAASGQGYTCNVTLTPRVGDFV